MGQRRLLAERSGDVWETVFDLVKQVTGDVDAAGKGNLQEQIDTILEEMDAGKDSVSVIDDTGRTITTTYANGTKAVSVMDDTSITETVYDAEDSVVSKTGMYITDNKIEIKELRIDEE